MGEKIPLLQQTVETLRKNEKEDLANELDKLIGELLTHLQNKEKNAITETTQRIDQFLKANKAEIGSELTALASEVEETQKQSSRRSRFW